MAEISRRRAKPAVPCQDVRRLVEENPDGLLLVDRASICRYASPSASRLLGRPPEAIVGRSLFELPCDTTPALQAAIVAARSGHTEGEASFRTERSADDHLWIEARFGPADENGEVVVTLRDVSVRRAAELALRAANAELMKLSGSDGLTRLANRRRFDHLLESECRRASRHGIPLTLLLLDLDRFRTFNDRYGIEVGDSCLKEVANLLRSTPSGTAARFSGAEFIMLFADLEESGGTFIAERLRRAVADLRIAHADNTEGGIMTVSIGVATIRPTADSFESDPPAAVARASRALLEAKRLGRNRVIQATPLDGLNRAARAG